VSARRGCGDPPGGDLGGLGGAVLLHLLGAEEFRDLLSAARAVWRVLVAPDAVAAPMPRAGLRRNALTRVGNLAKSGQDELQTARNGSYPAAPMVAAELHEETFATRLADTRRRRGFTRRQLCTLAGYSSETTLRQYESGRVAAPRDNIVFRFAEALGVDSVWLLTGRGDPNWKP
jgi:Helix-turn-helix domain